MGAIPPPVHPARDVRAWFAGRVVAELELWIAKAEPQGLVGILVLEDDWIDQLYVEPVWTGRGVGTALLDRAKHERPGGLRLWTFASNTGAQRFYERHGFTALEWTDGRGNEEQAPDVLYAWPGAGGSGGLA